MFLFGCSLNEEINDYKTRWSNNILWFLLGHSIALVPASCLEKIFYYTNCCISLDMKIKRNKQKLVCMSMMSRYFLLCFLWFDFFQCTVPGTMLWLWDLHLNMLCLISLGISFLVMKAWFMLVPRCCDQEICHVERTYLMPEKICLLLALHCQFLVLIGLHCLRWCAKLP